MANLPTTCPSCRGDLTAVRLKCENCQTQLEGAFHIPEILRLPGADLEFIVQFVKASGSLKEMARQYGQSYPTIRNRLDDVIAKLGAAEPREAKERQAILDRIADGTLSVAAAEPLLRRLTR